MARGIAAVVQEYAKLKSPYGAVLDREVRTIHGADADGRVPRAGDHVPESVAIQVHHHIAGVNLDGSACGQVCADVLGHTVNPRRRDREWHRGNGRTDGRLGPDRRPAPPTTHQPHDRAPEQPTPDSLHRSPPAYLRYVSHALTISLRSILVWCHS